MMYIKAGNQDVIYKNTEPRGYSCLILTPCGKAVRTVDCLMTKGGSQTASVLVSKEAHVFCGGGVEYGWEAGGRLNYLNGSFKAIELMKRLIHAVDGSQRHFQVQKSTENMQRGKGISV